MELFILIVVFIAILVLGFIMFPVGCVLTHKASKKHHKIMLIAGTILEYYGISIIIGFLVTVIDLGIEHLMQ